MVETRPGPVETRASEWKLVLVGGDSSSGRKFVSGVVETRGYIVETRCVPMSVACCCLGGRSGGESAKKTHREAEGKRHRNGWLDAVPKERNGYSFRLGGTVLVSLARGLARACDTRHRMGLPLKID